MCVSLVCTGQAVAQLVYGGGDVPLLHPALLQLLHRAGELQAGEREDETLSFIPVGKWGSGQLHLTHEMVGNL